MEITFQVSTQTSFEASKKKRKATNPPHDSQPSKKQMKGRPARPTQKKIQPRKALTKLRKDRPIQASLSMDIWASILSFCSLERLLKLRGICSTFHSALAQDSVWKQARHNQFGVHHPDPPSGLTEMQYADLLVGVGCQALGCEAKDTRRTYWGFRRRWCEVCLVYNLSRVGEPDGLYLSFTDHDQGRHAKQDLLMYDQACKCIPQAKYDSWGHYQWVGHHNQAPAWAPLFSSQSVAYSKFDIRDMNGRIKDFMSTSPTDDELKSWFEKQEALSLTYVEQLQKVEHWVEKDRKLRDKERVETREKRAGFFNQRASQIDPPLTPDVLALCPSYERSIRISKVPSEKSWQKLLPKIMNERSDAVAALEKRKRRESHYEYRLFLKDIQDDTIERRKNLKSPEQRLVLDLAEQVICDVLVDPKGFHDSDLVHIILRGIYDSYQRLEDDEKPRNQYGPYRLIMDDARLVYTHKISPMIELYYGACTKSSARALKCPGRTCVTSHKTYEFEDLIQHLYKTHRYRDCFQHLLVTHHFENEWEAFPWYCTEWPRNIPMLAPHQKTPYEWDIDDDAPYVRAEPDLVPIKEQPVDVFHDNRPSTSSTPGTTFTDAILYAAGILKGVNLNKRYKSMIALEFARGRNLLMYNNPVTQNDLHDMIVGLRRSGYSDVFDDHCCLRCQSIGLYCEYAIQPHNFIDLIRHYLEEHGNADDWGRSMIAFPDGIKLFGTLTEGDNKPAFNAFYDLFKSIDLPVTPWSCTFPPNMETTPG